MSENNVPLLSTALATFISNHGYDEFPEAMRRWTKLMVLDAVGNAYASTRFEFARKALNALSRLGLGDSTVIGMPERLALRDAVLMNGTLMHGLDYDDTSLPGGVHLSGSCVSTAFALCEPEHSCGKDFLPACALGFEAGVRLGAASKSSFLKLGFHPTSLIGTFAGTLVAGRLWKLSHAQLVMAQGIALSFASGNMQPTQEGAWSKRLHAGWGGAAGVTAASMASQGFTGPLEAYEGRFGLFPSFLGPHAADADLSLATHELGERWEFSRSSIKLYPVCYHSHAFMRAATEMRNETRLDTTQIASIKALVAPVAVPMICEPLETRRKPHNSYATQFSLPYALACCLIRGRFGLEEIEESAYTDPQLLALAQKVCYEIDSNTGWPKFRTGEIIVRMKNGEEIRRRKSLYPDEPPADKDIIDKFMDNTRLSMSSTQAESTIDLILNIERVPDMSAVTRILSGQSR